MFTHTKEILDEGGFDHVFLFGEEGGPSFRTRSNISQTREFLEYTPQTMAGIWD